MKNLFFLPLLPKTKSGTNLIKFPTGINEIEEIETFQFKSRMENSHLNIYSLYPFYFLPPFRINRIEDLKNTRSQNLSEKYLVIQSNSVITNSSGTDKFVRYNRGS